jgi:hypothetical protein
MLVNLFDRRFDQHAYDDSERIESVVTRRSKKLSLHPEALIRQNSKLCLIPTALLFNNDPKRPTEFSPFGEGSSWCTAKDFLEEVVFGVATRRPRDFRP